MPESDLEDGVQMSVDSYLQVDLLAQFKQRSDWALLYIDLRHFRLYNQLYGRAAGEQLLGTLTATIHSSLTANDRLYRVGGQEFLILCDDNRAEELARDICQKWEELSMSFYTRQDRQRGFLVGTDRRGIGRRCPLVAVNIGIVTSTNYRHCSLSAIFSAVLQANLMAPPATCNYLVETSHTSQYWQSPSYPYPILVVEPDAALAYLLQTTLEMHSYRVAVTSSGQEAFKLAVTDPPRVIILDLFTSDLPAGPFLCQELRRQPELRNTLLIVAATNADREEVLSAGADLFIPKPFELSDLLDWVDRVVEENAKAVDLPEANQNFSGFRRQLRR
ncbi:MAG: diguanylate cyclase [Gemmatimonadaceae bacterium]|nr:diguanylate cyclase [Gloeobacterales cyanobacterium ES-bin-141]